MGSCADRLHQIQRDVGLTEKELKAAVKEVCTPRQVQLPVLRERKSAQDKLREKMAKKSKKHQKRKLAGWFLETYLTPEVAQGFYRKYPDYHVLIDAVYEAAMGVIQLSTYVVELDVDPREAFPQPKVDELDIPDEQWEAFEKYCDKHPLRSVRDIWNRRRRFKKYLRKARYKKYSPRRLRMYDPMYAASAMDAKEMLKSIKEIGKQNETRIAKFQKLLDDLVKDQSIGAVAMERFSQQTDELMRQHRKRMNEFIKKTGQGKPQPFTMDWDGRVTTFDDWDDPDSLDSVLRIPIRDL